MIRRGLARSALPILLAAASIPCAGVPQAGADLDALARDVSARGCAAIAARVDAEPGGVPVLLRSYDAEAGSGESESPALRTAAFTYDNALAVIALLACGRDAQAARVGAALERAALADARLRNTYRAGAVGEVVLANGWWDAAQNRWAEDAYQAGSATGNVAWAGLALLALADATRSAHWRAASARLAHWVVANARDDSAAGGFNGGVHGFDAAPVKITWKSTEHAIDLVALFSRLARAQADAGWSAQAAHARAFLDRQWDAASGHFLVGTQADGATPNREMSALDVQWWPLLLTDSAPDWRRAIGYAERRHGVGAGFDFNDDRDGEWLEGTAQAALVYRSVGDAHAAARCLTEVAAQFSAGGYVYATREPKITTGLAIGPAGATADFFYYRRPHLGATAWAVLAARNRNPYRAAP